MAACGGSGGGGRGTAMIGARVVGPVGAGTIVVRLIGAAVLIKWFTAPYEARQACFPGVLSIY